VISNAAGTEAETRERSGVTWKAREEINQRAGKRPPDGEKQKEREKKGENEGVQ